MATGLRIPPPPPIANVDPAFNRWLLEVTSVLAAAGGVDPTQIPGYTDLQTTVATHTTEITALQGTTGGQGNAITVLQGEISVINGEIITINGQLTSLGARSQVFNGTADPASGFGNVGDWFANTSGGAGHRIFVKTGVATWFAFPF